MLSHDDQTNKLRVIDDQTNKLHQRFAQTQANIALCQEELRRCRLRMQELQRAQRTRETDAHNALPPSPLPHQNYSQRLERIDDLWKRRIDELSDAIERHEKDDLSKEQAELRQLQTWPESKRRLEQGIHERIRPMLQRHLSAILTRMQEPAQDDEETERLPVPRPPRRIEDIETKRLPPMPLYSDKNF